MDQERLTSDPANDALPNFASRFYAGIRRGVIADQGGSDEEAAQSLLDSWTREHEERIQRWERQQEEDREREQEEERPPEREEEERVPSPPVTPPRAITPLPPARPPPARSRVSSRAPSRAPSPSPPGLGTSDKKRKLNPLKQGKEIEPDRIPQPSAYALKKLKNLEYVELWYFTEKGCEEALVAAVTTPDDVFALSRVAGALALKSLDATSASKAVISDERLDWRDVFVAHKLLLHHMREQGWPDTHISALAKFYFHLEYHNVRRSYRGDDIIIKYQAEVRREWHRLISSPKPQEVFDISIISDRRLDQIDRQLTKDEQADYTARYCFPTPLS